MGLFSSGSAKRAANVQATGFKNAAINIGRGVDASQPYYDPYVEAGQQAMSDQSAAIARGQEMLNALDPRFDAMYGQVAALQPQVDEMYSLSQQQDPIVQDILSGGQGFETSPGYDWRLSQGIEGLESSASASGMLDSGNTGKALIEYGQNTASDEFERYMQRQYNALNAVGTQLGGRQAALGAGQSQVTQGLNIAGQEINQASAQQNLAAQYNNLINQGYSASQAQAALEMQRHQALADMNIGSANAYSAGMMAKDAELKNLGAGVLQAGGMAIGGVLGGPMGAQVGGQIGGALGGGVSGNTMPQITATGNTGYTTPQYTDIGNQMPWLQSSVPQSSTALGNNGLMQQAMLGSQSSVNKNNQLTNLNFGY